MAEGGWHFLLETTLWLTLEKRKEPWPGTLIEFSKIKK
jgi:hypothetical protein